MRLEFNIPGVTFGGRYDASPIIVSDGAELAPDEANTYVPTASPGGRPPHQWLADGSSLYDHFHSEWTLLVVGEHPPPTQAFSDYAEQLGIDLKIVSMPNAELLALYEQPLALIRPDQIVAWRGNSDTTAEAVLKQVLAW